MNEEIQLLMEELIMRRTQQKDYQSLENQIKCLRVRFENLKMVHANELQNEAANEQKRESMIQQLSNEIDQMH